MIPSHTHADGAVRGPCASLARAPSSMEVLSVPMPARSQELLGYHHPSAAPLRCLARMRQSDDAEIVQVYTSNDYAYDHAMTMTMTHMPTPHPCALAFLVFCIAHTYHPYSIYTVPRIPVLFSIPLTPSPLPRRASSIIQHHHPLPRHPVPIIPSPTAHRSSVMKACHDPQIPPVHTYPHRISISSSYHITYHIWTPSPSPCLSLLSLLSPSVFVCLRLCLRLWFWFWFARLSPCQAWKLALMSARDTLRLQVQVQVSRGLGFFASLLPGSLSVCRLLFCIVRAVVHSPYPVSRLTSLVPISYPQLPISQIHPRLHTTPHLSRRCCCALPSPLL